MAVLRCHMLVQITWDVDGFFVINCIMMFVCEINIQGGVNLLDSVFRVVQPLIVIILVLLLKNGLGYHGHQLIS